MYQSGAEIRGVAGGEGADRAVAEVTGVVVTVAKAAIVAKPLYGAERGARGLEARGVT